MTDPIAALGSEKFVSLTTFKRDGTGVATPMWIVRDAAALAVWTPADSWKVKRVRRDPRATLTPSTRMGKPTTDRSPVETTAEVLDDAATLDRIESLMRRKYGFQFTVVTFIERILARGRKPRAVLRLTVC